jgi:hypothetical protein
MLVRLIEVPLLKTSLVLFEKILVGQHDIIAETGTVKAKRQSNYGILILFIIIIDNNLRNNSIK